MDPDRFQTMLPQESMNHNGRCIMLSCKQIIAVPVVETLTRLSATRSRREALFV